MRKLVLCGLALGAIAMGTGAANAAQTFTLADVKFKDGTAVTGSFVTNNAFTAVKSFSISTSAGGIFFFDDTFSSAEGNVAQLTSSALTLTQGDIFPTTLEFDFSSPLSAAGALITGGSENSFIFSRLLASGGTVSLAAPTGAVPEPASWAMMILGMGAVGFAMRRRNVTTRVGYAA